MTYLWEFGLANAVLALPLAIAVWLIARAWRHPVFVHALWVIVLLKLLTPPIVSVPWQLGSRSTRLDASNIRASEELPLDSKQSQPSALASTFPPRQLADPRPENHESVFLPPANATSSLTDGERETTEIAGGSPSMPGVVENWSKLLMPMWLAGSGIYLAIAIVRLSRFHRALRRTAPAVGELCSWAADVARRLGVSRRYQLRVTAGHLSPLVWPIGRVTIVLPRPLVVQMSESEVKSLLAHEFAHLRRRDDWVRWLELAVTTIYWWHPVVWWARREIQSAEEQACDAWVVWAFPHAAKCYADALYRAVQFSTETPAALPAVASGLSSGGALKERIENVLDATWECRLGIMYRTLVLCFALLILPFSLHAALADVPESAGKGEAEASEAHSQVENETPAESIGATASSDQDNLNDAVAVPDASVVPAGETNGNRLGAEEQAILREHVDLLEKELRHIEAQFRSGLSGSVEASGTAATALAIAQSELALSEGRVTDALARCQEAIKHAAHAVQAITEQYRAGRVSYDRVLQALKTQLEARRRLIQLQRQSGSKTAPEELDVLRKHVDFLQQQFEAIDAEFQAGTIGGSPDVHAKASVELARAQGELALAEQRREDALVRLEEARARAKEALQAVTTAYQAGRASHDRVLEAAKDLTDISRQLMALGQPSAASSNPLATNIDRSPPQGQISPPRIPLTTRSEASFPRDESLRVLKLKAEKTKQDLERVKRLSDQQAIPERELADKEFEYRMMLERIRGAEIALRYYMAAAEVAAKEYESLVEANEKQPGSVSQMHLELAKLRAEQARLVVKAMGG